jgi:transposase
MRGAALIEYTLARDDERQEMTENRTIDAADRENAAREKIASLCRDIDAWGCPRCRSERVYRLGSGRLRCGGCGYTFHDLTGRFMGLGQLSPAQWLDLIALFVDEAPVKDAAHRMGVAYNTVYKAMDALRQAILHQAIDARQILEALRDWSIGSRPPVFGVMEQGGWVFVDLVPDVDVSDLTIFKLHFRLQTSRVGSVVYTGPLRGYLGLLCRGGPERFTARRKAGDPGLPLDEAGGFWTYLKDRLGRHQGVSAGKFPLYLKELEFRWNHRNRDWQDLQDRLARLALAFRTEGDAQRRT